LRLFEAAKVLLSDAKLAAEKRTFSGKEAERGHYHQRQDDGTMEIEMCWLGARPG